MFVFPFVLPGRLCVIHGLELLCEMLNVGIKRHADRLAHDFCPVRRVLDQIFVPNLEQVFPWN